jgi:hypothetical protein
MISPLATAIRTTDLLATSHDDRTLRRVAERGLLARVVRGSYLDADAWHALSQREKYIVTIRETLRQASAGLVVSHWSAAAVWGFPVVDEWPSETQVIDVARVTTNRTSRILRRPAFLLPGDVDEWEGLLITSPARTCADLALAYGFEAGVLAMDFALHLGACAKADIGEQLERQPMARRLRGALAALEFADHRSESAGESFSRMAIAKFGFPQPRLQEPFSDSQGEIGRTDFYWERFGLAAEFDGDQKYRDPVYLAGGTAADVVRDEKRRGVRLDAHPRVKRLVRWEYSTARHPERLAALLLNAGLPRTGC